jgi:hypothetical protein
VLYKEKDLLYCAWIDLMRIIHIIHDPQSGLLYKEKPYHAAHGQVFVFKCPYMSKLLTGI